MGVIAIFQYRSSPYFNLPILDEESYVSWAREIAAGEVMGKTVFYQDPLYPYFLGLIFSLLGQNLFAVRIVQVLMVTASVAIVFWTGRKLMGDGAGLAAALILALSRSVYFYELLILKTTMVILVSAASCALGVAAWDRPGSRARWVLLGLSLGLLALLRGNALAVLALVLAWLLLYPRAEAFRTRLARTALTAAGILIVLLPVAGRNLAVSGEFVLATSQGGPNFYIGNNGRADGTYVVLPFVRPEPRYEAEDFRAEAQKRAGHPLGAAAVSRFWYGEAGRWLCSHPGAAARLWAHKARLLVHNFEVPDNHSYYLTRDDFAWALWAGLIGFGWLWGAAALGAWDLLRRDRRAAYPALFAAGYAASLVPFFILARYRVALLPALAVFAARTTQWAWEKWKVRDRTVLTVAGAWLAVSLLISLVPTRESSFPPAFACYNLGNAYFDLGRPREAMAWYDRALKTMPGDPDCLANREQAAAMLNAQVVDSLLREARERPASQARVLELGRQLEQMGALEAAGEVYEIAARRDPGSASAWNRLGRLYLEFSRPPDPIQAREYFLRSLEADPDQPEVMTQVAETYLLAGDSLTARQWREQTAARFPGYAPRPQNRGRPK